MNHFYRKILFFCFLFYSVHIEAQVKFSTTLTPAVISRDEYTTIRFFLENAGDVQNIIPPSFNDFLIISGPLQESGMSNLNGAVSNYLAISFVFKARSPGKYLIPGAIAKVAGKNYKSNPVELIVKKTRSANLNNSNLPPSLQNIFDEPRPMNTFNDYIFKDGENVAEKVNKNMQLRLDVNKNSCYVGEPVVASYKLYTRLKSESKLTQNPSFNGFSVVDLQASDVSASSIEKLNGRDYNVYTIRKAQLYPLQEGKIVLESAEIENKIQFIRESYAKNNTGIFSDLFDEFANATVPPEALIDQTVILRSKPGIIDVKPLPEAGKPSGFKGAVGEFAIEAGLEKNSFPAGSGGKLIVMVSGSGNLQLVTPPTVAWPDGIEAFETKTSDILSMTSIPVSGKKIFEYPITVDKPGNYTIPPVQFSYFDPFKKIYKTIRTSPIPFAVTMQTAVPMVKDSVTPVKTEKVDSKIYNEKWITGILGLLAIGGLFIFIKKGKSRAEKIKEEKNSSVQQSVTADAIFTVSSIGQQNPLAETEKCLGNGECVEFYASLLREIKEYLAVKFAITPAEINNKRLTEKMDRKNISNETVLALQQLLQDIEWQIYTPFECNEKMEDYYRRAHELLQMINTYDTKVL